LCVRVCCNSDMTETQDMTEIGTPKPKIRTSKPKGPKAKDFGGPKSSLTPYFLFGNAVRPDVTNEIKKEAAAAGKPFQITAVGTRIAEMWKKLPEEKKTSYEEEAKVIKAKYVEDTAVWKASPEYQKFLDAQRVFKRGQVVKNLKNAAMDKGMPKKPKTAYMIFADEHRGAITADLKAKGEKVAIPVLAKVIATKWRETTTEQQQPYFDKANALRAEYTEAYKKFQETDEGKEFEKTMVSSRKRFLKNPPMKAKKRRTGKVTKSEAVLPEGAEGAEGEEDDEEEEGEEDEDEEDEGEDVVAAEGEKKEVAKEGGEDL